ncbi:MAG: hypothetical protein ACOYNL_10220 [Rickettsiales bacterium]
MSNRNRQLNDTSDAPQEPKKRTLLNREIAYGITGKEWLTSGMMGVVGAIVSGAKTVRDRFMDDVKNAPGIREKIEENAAELSKNSLANSGMPFKEWAKGIRKLKRTQAEGIAEEINKRWGVGDGLVVDTFRRISVLSNRSRNTIAFNGSVGAVLGAAMALSFFNGVATRDRIERIEDAVVDNPTHPSQHSR